MAKVQASENLARFQTSENSESLDKVSGLSRFLAKDQKVALRPLKFRGPKVRQPTAVHCTSTDLFFLLLICLVVGVITLILLRRSCHLWCLTH